MRDVFAALAPALLPCAVRARDAAAYPSVQAGDRGRTPLRRRSRGLGAACRRNFSEVSAGGTPEEFRRCPLTKHGRWQTPVKTNNIRFG